MLNEAFRLAGWRGRCLAILALASVAAAVLAAPAMAAPVLSIKMTHLNPFGQQATKCPSKVAEPMATPPCGVNPLTEKEAGDKGETFAEESGHDAYTITVTNTGTEPAAHPVKVVLKLPEGIIFSQDGTEFKFPGWNCKIDLEAFKPGEYEGPREFTCEQEASASLAAGKSSEFTLYVRTSPQALMTHSPTHIAVATASDSGDGVAAVSTTAAEGETPITAAVPFGIACFTVGAEAVEQFQFDACNRGAAANEKATPTLLPFTQAGGHPFAYTSEVVYNYTTAISGVLAPAGGASKDTEVELPPGFAGNPQNTPRCPLAQLTANKCPSNTALGYALVNLGGEIVNGKPSFFPKEPVNPELTSLVYNMEPPPGHPAELGFVVIKGLPILLEAELRSDGDYGITIGDPAGSNGSKIMSVKLTTCENGASGFEPNFHCNPVTAGSPAFVANPTQCTSSEPGKTAAPETGVRANRWGTEPEQEEYRGRKAFTGVSAGVLTGLPNMTESLLSGCGELHFNPEVEFKPSAPSEGGTQQADEPTGMTFNMKLPQASEIAPSTAVGQTVTCQQGMWSNVPTGYAYEWLHNGEVITGEAGRTYTLKSPDEGKDIQCQVTASNGGVAAAAASPVLVVAPAPATGPPVPPTVGGIVSLPALVGTGEVGKPLTCTPETALIKWLGGPTFTYQWLRNGVALGAANGAQTATYTVQEADKESALQCEVTGTNAGGAVSAVSASKETKPLPASKPPANVTFAPQVSGEGAPPVTSTLKNLLMTLPEGLTVSPSAAHGLETCSNEQFWPPEQSGAGPAEHREPTVPAECPRASQIGTVEVFTPLLSGAPTLTGLPSKGSVLTCSQGMWSVSPQSFEYQWLRNGEVIAGAASSEYTLPSEEPLAKEAEGKAIQCRVIATNTGGGSAALSRDSVVGGSSVQSLPQPPLPPASIAAPSGTAEPGHVLTCATGGWASSSALGAFKDQWLRNGVSLGSEDGAQTATYTVQPGDAGSVIQCQVTGKNTVGETVADSAAVVISPVPSPPPPLPGAAVQGQLFLAEPECGTAKYPEACSNEYAEGKGGPEHNRSLFRLFIQAQDRLGLPPGSKEAGVIVKLHGLNRVNTATGQITAVFEKQPQQPFELLSLKLKGGPTAPLDNPQTCGVATTTTDITPWSAPGLGGLTGSEAIAGIEDARPSASYDVGAGEACPSAMPFNPAFNAGTTGANATAADASPSFSLTFSRQDREGDLSGVQVFMPPGLVGKIAGIPLCAEAQANAGTCGPESQIGTAEAGAGAGSEPYFEQGRVYLTGPTTLKDGLHGPFGLSVVTPTKTKAFDLGNVVVRSVIDIDPHTAAVTATSDPLPQMIDGVPLRIRTVNVSLNRPGFMLNPTSCSAQKIAATLTSTQGASASVASPFGLGGCTSLAFHPVFTATTQGKTSKTEGASLDVKITYPPGAYANIAKSVTELPIALPSRLTTIQKACPDTVFEANPASCDEWSVIGHAVASTPLLEHPLVGPAYLVSHGNRAFPDIEIVLQGEGITVDLDGLTDIKKGITKTTFESLPDSPISTFELNLPEGPHSALAAPASLCEQTALDLPTILTGQNGAVLKQDTKIAVTGCPPTVSLTKAKLSGNALEVTVKVSASGTVRISGKGLKTVKKSLRAGSYQIRVPFTKVGKSLRKRHKQTSLHVSLTVGKQAVAKATNVRL